MRRISFKIIYLLIFVFFCLNCHSISKVEAPVSSENPPPLTEVFENLGFQLKSFSEGVPSDWLKENYRTQKIKVFQIKSQTSLKDQSETFPRFKVVEEFYETSQLAAKRLERIQEKPPNLPAEQDYYWMVTGFQQRKKIYFIQTDAAAFLPDLQDFADKLSIEISRKLMADDKDDESKRSPQTF